MASQDHNRARTYDLIHEYQINNTSVEISDPNYIGTSPSWLIAVWRLGCPVTFSRRTMKSIGTVLDRAFTRKERPLFITDDCVDLSISNPKHSHTKTLTATLKHSRVNYLDQDVLLPGDWLIAWCFNNNEDLKRIVNQVLEGVPANGPYDGIKFLGRVHNIRKGVNVNGASGTRNITYGLQAIGFEELDTQFYYDTALADASFASSFTSWMAKVGLDFSKIAEKDQIQAGNIKDNADKLIPTLIDIVLGKGINSKIANLATKGAIAAARAINPSVLPNNIDNLKPILQTTSQEAPYAYLVPRGIGLVFGRQTADASKTQQVFGYADILETLIGVQEYSNEGDDNTSFLIFYPKLRSDSTESRKFCEEKLKGTFLPVNPSFVNRPIWQTLQQYLNPAINEMYTAMRLNDKGVVVPTLIARQIPFSTESISERSETTREFDINADEVVDVKGPPFKVTRFLSLPRWRIHPTMVWSLNVGRSNATRFNLVHVYGDASVFASNRSIQNMMLRNPPIIDEVDIQRSGVRGYMQTVNCAVIDQVRTDGARLWMEAIADWSFDSQYTLNGTIECTGIQSPIAEGDNCELEDVAYHIESVTHRCSVSADGHKMFRTTLEISRGMPIDQGDSTADFPRYPGFKNTTRLVSKFHISAGASEEGTDTGSGNDAATNTTITSSEETDTVGDPTVLTSQDPITNLESSINIILPKKIP